MLWVSGCVVASFRLGCLCKWLLVPSSPDCGYSRCGRWVSSEGSFLVCLLMSSVGGVGLCVETFDCGI